MLLTLIHVDTPPKDFYSAKISTFKSIGEEHPEVLAEWRAKRAASFVAKHADPTHPPPARDMNRVSFRPGGILPAKTTAFTHDAAATTTGTGTRALSANATLKPRNTVTLQPVKSQQLDMKALSAELAKTE